MKAWFMVDEMNAWADKKLKENPHWNEASEKQDIPDLIAGALGVSRGTAYDLMREALAEQPAQQEPLKIVSSNDMTDADWDRLFKPPASKPWVGLTDEELSHIYEEYHDCYGQPVNGNENGWAYERAIIQAANGKGDA